jgi:N6-adenosine-specific RNA methylase IME4
MSFTGLPLNHYQCVLADPPWAFATYNERGRSRCPDWRNAKGMPTHYSVMSTRAICRLPVDELAAKDCALFLWISWPMLQDALQVIDMWGFKFKTCAFCWVKSTARGPDMFSDPTPAMGWGYWTRANSEVCLLATRGRPKRLHADVPQVIIEPRREHSRKPDCVHDRIERLVAGPYLELFARARRPGWDSHGNETDKFRGAA